MAAQNEDDARFDHLSIRKSGFLDLGGKWEATPGRDQYSGDGRSALADAERQANAPLTVTDVLTITPERSWRARWKAIAKYYRRLYQHPVTNFCPNCEAAERRNAELDRIAALLPEAWYADDAPPTEEEFLRYTEQLKRYGEMSIGDTFDRMDADAAELAQLRTLATAAAGFCAENVGMEVTENGRRLRAAVGEWNRATAGDKATPPEYQCNGGDNE